MSSFFGPQKNLSLESSAPPAVTKMEPASLDVPETETVKFFLSVMASNLQKQGGLHLPDELTSPIKQMLMQILNSLDSQPLLHFHAVSESLQVPMLSPQSSDALKFGMKWDAHHKKNNASQAQKNNSSNEHQACNGTENLFTDSAMSVDKIFEKDVSTEFKKYPVVNDDFSPQNSIPALSTEKLQPLGMSNIALNEIPALILSGLIKNLVTQLLVSESLNSTHQVRLVLNGGILQGVEVVLQEKSGQLHIDFVCPLADSRNLLMQVVSKGASETARRCKRDLLFRIYDEFNEDESQTFVIEAVST